MASIQERLQIKREPLDKWSIREQLCLAVARKSDQNLTSVSRVLKQFAEPNRPTDWFNQKNCAAQYHALLANCETPKRKKRTSSGDIAIETPAESILKKLLNERKAELKRLLAEEKAEYTKLQSDLTLLQSGNVSEEQLDNWCKEIDEEERKKEQEAIAYAEWLRERELRKQEIERAWRPVVRSPMPGQKRKNSDSIDGLIENDSNSEEVLTTSSPTITTTTVIPTVVTTIVSSTQQEQATKPALSPLLTSLLKSPSQVPNVTSASILHSAITNQRTTINTNTNPMISSLLNSSANVQVSPSLQQLVSTAIGQQQQPEPEPEQEQEQLEPVQVQETIDNTTNIDNNNSEQTITGDILDDENLPNLKIDDIANSILVSDGQLPEMKNDVDVIISDLIENAHDIVNDPEQHLQIDNNGDLNLNLDFDDEDNDNNHINKDERQEDTQKEEIVNINDNNNNNNNSNSDDKEEKLQVIDPFEFKEEDYEQTKTDTDLIKKEENENSDDVKDIDKKEILKNDEKVEKLEQLEEKHEEQEEIESDQTKKESLVTNESVEITIDKVDVKNEKSDIIKTEEAPINVEKSKEEVIKNEINLDVTPIITETTTTTVFNEELYDDLNMEVKVDKSGKAKRDYSRTKKKEDKEFDVLLTLEKVNDDIIDDYSDKDYDNKEKLKIKNDNNERSNSPWTEEDDGGGGSSNNSNNNLLKVHRRVSTPIDSIPNSPVSSTASYYDDNNDHQHQHREYRNWKKSVMLVYNRLAANKYASLFSKPITDDQAPGYHSIVYRPMDLLTIRKNIENGTIRTTQEFQRDVLLMFNNAIMYNKTNDTIYNMARQMQQESIQQIQILLQAQQQIDVPSRRETRTSEPGCKRKRAGNDENVRNKKRKDD